DQAVLADVAALTAAADLSHVAGRSVVLVRVGRRTAATGDVDAVQVALDVVALATLTAEERDVVAVARGTLAIRLTGGPVRACAHAVAVAIAGRIAVAVAGRIAVAVTGRIAVAIASRIAVAIAVAGRIAVAVAVAGRIAVAIAGRIAVAITGR